MRVNIYAGKMYGKAFRTYVEKMQMLNNDIS